nr:hypothetical protein [Tanacetum cinerariifolium]
MTSLLRHRSPSSSTIKSLYSHLISSPSKHVPLHSVNLTAKITAVKFSSSPSKVDSGGLAAEDMVLDDADEDEYVLVRGAVKTSTIPTLLQPRVVVYDGVCHLCHRDTPITTKRPQSSTPLSDNTEAKGEVLEDGNSNKTEVKEIITYLSYPNEVEARKIESKLGMSFEEEKEGFKLILDDTQNHGCGYGSLIGIINKHGSFTKAYLDIFCIRAISRDQ